MKMMKYSLVPLALLILTTVELRSQELPRPSMVKKETPLNSPTDYNLKLGPVLVNVDGSLDGTFNDNIGLTDNGAKSDFILSPQIGIDTRWPITPENTLRFDISAGYNKYLIHPQYDTSDVAISPNSALQFDLYVGDFKINLHDNFSWTQDPTLIGGVSNVVNFGQFQNTAGIGVLWDLNKVILTLGYDHITSITTNIQQVDGSNVSGTDQLDYNADQISGSATFIITPTIKAGIEVAASDRYYDDNDIEDKILSVGPFVKADLTENLNISASAGYQVADTSSGTLNINSSELSSIGLNPNPNNTGGTTNSYYANLSLNHRLNRYYKDVLTAGHELQVDVFSQQSEVSYVNYSSSWKVSQSINLSFTLSYEDVNETGGNTLVPSYESFTAGAQANFPITERISGALLYTYDQHFDSGSNDYAQNRVGFLMNYHF